MTKSYKIQVFGRVQGVWFRASAKKTARKLGLKGIVKNQPDGSVYIEAEGPEEALKQFVEWCQEGPDIARVENCQWEEQPNQNYSEFEIIR